MESPKDNTPSDIHSTLSKMMSDAINKLQDDYIRNVDASHLTKEKALHMIHIISHAEVVLDILLTQTEEIGGFGSFYPQKSLELLKTMKCILQAEIDEQV